MIRARAARAFAPATIGNVAVGFDLLGCAVEGAGDVVAATELSSPIVELEGVFRAPGSRGVDSDALARIPKDPAKNTATVGLLAMIRELGLRRGFRVRVEKGIPLGSGMGGSAASSVAAVVAANALLPRPLPREKLLRYALLGESVASGSMHADNVAPCLFGGLTLAPETPDGPVVRLPVPAGLVCVLVHPHLELATRDMRRLLKPAVPLADFVRQQRRLAGFLSGLYENDWARLAASLEDVLIEPQRAKKIPGFAEAKRAALASGAAGFSISGSGPSVFAWTRGKPLAAKVQRAIRAAFARAGLETEAWSSPVSAAGAGLL